MPALQLYQEAKEGNKLWTIMEDEEAVATHHQMIYNMCNAGEGSARSLEDGSGHRDGSLG